MSWCDGFVSTTRRIEPSEIEEVLVGRDEFFIVLFFLFCCVVVSHRRYMPSHFVLHVSHQIVDASVHVWVLFATSYNKSNDSVGKANRYNGSANNATQPHQEM